MQILIINSRLATLVIFLPIFLGLFGTSVKAQDLEAFSIDQESGIVIQQINEGSGSEAPLYYTTFNVDAAKTIATDRCQEGGDTGFDLSGADMEIGMWDAGAVRWDHQEFGGRIVIVDNPDFVNDAHATHVAGTLCASGFNPAQDAKGMAPSATVLSHDWNNDYNEMNDFASNGGLISNHSYGPIRGWHFNAQDGQYYWFGDVFISEEEDGSFGRYDISARAWDNLAVQNPDYLIFKSAGNDRGHQGPPQGQSHLYFVNGQWLPSDASRNSDGPWDCLGNMSNSKNIMVIGAIRDLDEGYTTPGSVTLTSFSSVGPCDDGRIKPDLVANGHSLNSTSSTGDDQYSTKSGTSMSSPSAAASALLVQEQSMNVRGEYLSSAELRGLLIHTCDEAGPFPGPDYQFGWGVMNTAAAAAIVTDDAEGAGNNTMIAETLSNGDELSYSFYNDGSIDIKTTIAWLDPAGIPLDYPYDLDDDSPMLVNDLDIRLIHEETGYSVSPYRLSASQPENAATQSDNSVDNVEVIYLNNPEAGYYTLRVSHKGNLQGNEQDFALILSGQTESCPETPAFTYEVTGNTVYFELNNFDTETIVDVVWDFGDGLIDGGWDPDITHLFYDPGNFEVCVEYFPIESDYCEITQHCESVTIEDPTPCGPQPEIVTVESLSSGVQWLEAGEGGDVLLYGGNQLIYYDGNNTEEFSHGDIGISDGSSVYAIYLDDNSTFYLGTPEGLIYYDGNSFENIWNETITDLERDASGDLWLLSPEQVYKKIGNDYEAYGPMSTTPLHKMSISSNGTIWATSSEFVYAYSDGNWQDYSSDAAGLSGGSIMDLQAVPNGEVFLLSSNNIVSQYTDGNWTNPTLSNHLVSSEILTDLEANPEGDLYIGASPGGINWNKNGTWHQLSLNNSNLSGGYPASAIDFTSDGSLWFASGNEIVFVPADYEQAASFDLPSIECINVPITFNNTSSTENTGPLTAWYIDGEWVSDSWNLFWIFEEIGSHWVRLEVGEGECKSIAEWNVILKDCAKLSACESGWITFEQNEICPDGSGINLFNSMTETANGDLYFTGQSSLRWRQQDESWHTLSVPPSYCVATIDDDFAIFGSEDALYMTSGNTVETINASSHPDIFPSSFSVQDISVDLTSVAWLAIPGESGLVKYVESEWSYLEVSPSLDENSTNVKIAAIDSEHAYLIQDDELRLINGDVNELLISLPEYGVEETVKEIVVRAGVAYFITSSKMMTYEDGIGLSVNENISGMLGDLTGISLANNNSGLWISSSNGLGYFENGASNLLYQIPDNSSDFKFADIDSQGNIWTSNTTQLIQYLPQAILPNIIAPTGILCAGESIYLETDLDNTGLNFQWEYWDAGTDDLVFGNLPYFEINPSTGGEIFVLFSVQDIETGCLLSNEVLLEIEGDCVFPGDVDGDGTVGMLDVLLMGTSIGETGPARENGSWDFTAQACEDWDATLAGNRNAKHADTKGLGVVTHDGAEVIHQNYALSQSGLSTSTQDGLNFLLDGPEYLLPDVPYTFAVNIGTPEAPISNFYGASATIYLNGLFDDVILDFDHSFVSESGEFHTFIEEFDDRIDVAIYTDDANGIDNAEGELMRLTTIMVIDNVSDEEDVIPFDINVQNITLLDKEFDILSLGNQAPNSNGALFTDPVLPPLENETNSISTCDSEPLFLQVAPNMATYTWFLNGEVLDGVDGNIHYATESGNYYIDVVAPSGLTLDPVYFNVEYNPISKPVISELNNLLETDLEGSSYEWFYNGGIIPNANEATYLATERGYYAVRVTNTSGCSAISNSIFIDLPIEVQTIIEDLPVMELVDLNLFPNPFESDLQIEIPTSIGKSTLRIFQMDGKLAYQESLTQGVQKLQLGHLPAGSYTLEISNESSIRTTRIIKQP